MTFDVVALTIIVLAVAAFVVVLALEWWGRRR